MGISRRKTMSLDLRLRWHLAFFILLLASAFQTASAQSAPFGPHLWDQPLDPAIFEKRVNEQLGDAQQSISQLLAVKEARTIENTLAPYDDAVAKLDLAAGQSGLMQVVSPDANIR